MPDASRRLVAAGYDRIADIYVERFGASAVRQKWVNRLRASLPAGGGGVLDLGCGAGVPLARDLAALGHRVTGVDGSRRQIARARQNVPNAAFIEADMCQVEFEAHVFDAVGAFYSLTHIPPAEQGPLIARIATWLKPGGVLVASFGAGPAGEWMGEWLGVPMYFGHCGEVAALTCLAEAGFRVRRSSIEKQDNEETAFLWIEAAT